MKKRSLLTVLLSGILFLIPLSSCGSKSPGGNTPDIPLPPVITYIDVSTVEELKGLSGQKDNYKLVNDIDLTGVEWTPIDNFTGILEGSGKKISGFSISSNKTNLGLFSTLGGTVKNLSLVDVSINCTGDEGTVGALCGTNTGTIENVAVSGEISAKYYNNVGGIAGKSTNSNITKCKNECVVTAYDNVGGIVGVLTTGDADTFTENENNGKINGNSCVGGISGLINTSQNFSNIVTTVSKHKNNGEINAFGDNVGGIVGNLSGGAYKDYYTYSHTISLSNCTNFKQVNGNNNTGGIIGYGTYVTEIASCGNEGNITGVNYIGGFAGKTATSTLMKILENKVTITGKAFVGGIAGYTGSLLNCTNNGQIVSNGVAIESSTSISCVGGIAGYAISIEKCVNKVNIKVSTDGLYVGGLVGKLSPVNGSCVKDNENIGEISGYKYIGGIVGSIKISNASSSNWVVSVTNNKNDGLIIAVDSYAAGLIGSAEGEVYKDYYTYTHSIAITDCINNKTVMGKDYTGGIVGYGIYVNEISTCENNSNITGNNYVGGYAGYTTRSTLMKLLENKATITGKAYIGGIAGYTGKLLNCKNDGSIVSEGIVLESTIAISCVGGIAGSASSIDSCINNSNLSVLNKGLYVGGLVGKLSATNGSVLKNCTNNGDISSNGGYIGGLVGLIKASDSSSSNWTLIVENCVNNGTVRNLGVLDYTGGIAGSAEGEVYKDYYLYDHAIVFSNCSNTKPINGNNYTGGIIGYGTYVNEMNLCSNTANITGNNYVGGYAGYTSTRTLIQFAENRNKITGNAYVGGIAGYTGALRNCANYGEISSNGVIVENSINVAYVGGIAGFASSLEGCTNNSNITVQTGGQYVGGLVGYLAASGSSKLNNCLNYGDIVSNSSYVGGIVGYINANDASSANWTLKVENNENYGAVTTTENYAGGIVGAADGGTYKDYYTYNHTVSFSGNKNYGDITANKYVGGILGRGTYVDKTEVVWETNINQSIITGETSGELYGELA